jgi:hypothetical protein
MDIPVEYYGFIEMGLSFGFIALFLGWQLWSLREKPGDQKPDDESDP